MGRYAESRNESKEINGKVFEPSKGIERGLTGWR